VTLLQRKIKILDLVPIIYTEGIKAAIEDRMSLAKRISEETNGLVVMDVVTIDKGAASIESAYDEYINAPYIIQKVKWAEEQGYSAVVIDCFGDPALDAAREVVKIPVVGANHAATFLASQIAHGFSVISILPEVNPLIIHLLRKYRLIQHLVSIETIHVPVLELEKDPEKVVKTALEAAERAFAKGAGTLVLGCTGMSFLADSLQKRLLEKGIEIPVVEPLRAAIYTAVSWVLMRVSHSKLTYPKPREKLRVL
jgi:allantoin racemase